MAVPGNKVKKHCRCIECSHSKLIRWGKDPIIAVCHKGSKVAEIGRFCNEFEKRKGMTPPIQQR